MNLHDTLEDLRRFLPIQFPLGVFIHNNMLLAFEDRPFKEGVAEAAAMFGARRTLPEAYYQDKWKQGRISEVEAKAQLAHWMEIENIVPMLGGKPSKDILWHLMLNPVVIPYRVMAKDEDATFSGWMQLTEKIQNPTYYGKLKQTKQWKTVFAREYGEDIDGLFQSVMIRFLGAYLDQGMATWHNPDTHRGLLESFRAFIATNKTVGPTWMNRLFKELPTIPLNDVEGWLEAWLVKLPYVEQPRQYLLQTMLELRGWAGMVNKFEKEPHLIPRFTPKITLVDYLAIYLLLERSAYEATLEKLGLSQMPALYEEQVDQRLTDEQTAYLLHKVGDELHFNPLAMKAEDAQHLAEIVIKFNEEQRCLIWHHAFDMTVRNNCLNVLASNLKQQPNLKVPIEARAYFCIDDREESFRRYVEEANPRVETCGVVGFFGLDMRYKSVDHPEPVTHCPPVVAPSRVIEQVVLDNQGARRVSDRRFMGQRNQHFYYGTRAALTSFFYTFITGPFTSFVLLLRVFFPSFATGLLARVRNFVVKPLPTKINFNAEEGGGGYSVPEMANVVATIMKFTGTIKEFPRLQFMIAHGASSSNNPYKNAYGCGACSGKAGIPNSQIFCGMANNAKVRDELRTVHQIDIPKETFFVACYHDTSTDEVLCFNEEFGPAETRADLKRILGQIRNAAEKNSLERSRHFAAGRTLLDEKITFQHVKNRAANLAEPRPEYGHTNNALCVIGRRELTKDLYLDRRSFLTSYDAKTDPAGKVLAQVMAGAVPVAGGINLDYYFSRVDNETYGSGTKLPLNVSGLLGVMTGGSSDLRIGLAGQMVELHEPVRITILIEAEPDIIQGVLENAPRQKRLVHNGWIHMAALSPSTGQLYIHQNGAFVTYEPQSVELPVIKDMRGYVAHQRGPLPFGRLAQAGAKA